jgi:DNA repair photolyase
MERVHYVQSEESIKALSGPHPLFKVEASLSPYAGCRARCVFCPFGGTPRLGVKTRFLHLLEKKLSQEKKQVHVGLGTTCEPYCREEDTFHLTHNTIELVAKHRLPLQIFTKSERILRDVRLLREYSQQGLCAVSVSLFTLDPVLAGMFEPDAPAPETRLELLKALKKKEVFAGVTLAPIVPYISDDPALIEELFRRVKRTKADYILPSVLAIETPAIKKRVFSVVADQFPRIEHRLKLLYDNDRLPSITYTQRVYDMLKVFSAKYRIPLYLPTHSGADEHAGIRHKLLA